MDGLATDDNGDFVLTLSAAPAEGDWLKLEPDAYIVVIRRLVSHWEMTDEGLWEVLNLTTLGKGSSRPTPESIAQKLDDAVTQTRDLRELLTIAHRITFQLATGISARLIKLTDLDQHLPSDTPRVDPAERARIVAARQAAISWRYAGGS